MVSGTIFDGGRSLTAQSVEAFYTSLAHFPMLSIGLNCALGPAQMRPYVEALSGVADCRISCYPNAGMPDGMGGFDSSPGEVAGNLRDFAENGWVNIVGGCCGRPGIHPTDCDAARAQATSPAGPAAPLKLQQPEPDGNSSETTFVMVGERTNVTGSRKFARG